MRTSSVRGRMEAEHPEGPRPCSGLPPAAGTRSAVRAGRGAEAGMEESVGRLDVFGAPRSPTVTTQPEPTPGPSAWAAVDVLTTVSPEPSSAMAPATSARVRRAFT